MNQQTLMKYDPATGQEQPYPSHAQQWRQYYGQHAWLFNPWTGQHRNSADVGVDPWGQLILPVGEKVFTTVEHARAAAVKEIRARSK